MAWSTPLTAVSNNPLTAAQWNASVRDNLLTTAPALATGAGQHFVSTGANAIAARTTGNNSVGASETTNSTSYTDLATVGPSVSVVTGAAALVLLYCYSQITGSGGPYMSFAVSGATTIAASDTNANGVGGAASRTGSPFFVSLTPGTNTFTAKYRSTVGGANVATFQDRRIIVVPF